MDAGLAAVLGALAGAVATTGAAFATGWATREQARINARAEHKRQRREPRERAYKEFLTEATALRNLLKVVEYSNTLAKTIRRDMLSHEVITQAQEIEERLKGHWLEVTLAGPESVQEPAAVIESASSSLVGLTSLIVQIPWSDEEEEAHWRHARSNILEIIAALREFTKQAQAVLDDDGTERSTFPDAAP